MEIWDVVTLVLGSNAVIALSSFFLTKYQISQSYKRFEKELQIANEKEQRQRRREVRSEPLLKLRETLALMATKLQILVTNTQLSSNQSPTTEEAEKKKSQQALDNWRDYVTSGDFLPTLNLQYDTEITHLIEPIENGYLLLFEYALDWKNLREGEQKAFRDISLNTNKMIPEVQELINKRLEEL
jgi:hypothetical protein